MTAAWHRTDRETPADGARVVVRNGHGKRPARWDGTAREWWWNSATEDWRASLACYDEWCVWDGRGQQEQEPRQMGLGLN